MEGKEKWVDDTPWGDTSADGLSAGSNALQPQYLPLDSQEAGDLLTGGCGHFELDEFPVKDFRDGDVEHVAYFHSQDSRIHPGGVEVMQYVLQ